ncbi:hypothetical protein C8T65DRAFT_755562 [Cerioporus squamosus]|nr:hypothetical protein C8T65DRAFT_755562 [Cerioporus squamosus]
MLSIANAASDHSKRSCPVPPVLCTGFDITDALRRYLEDGHGIDLAFPDSSSDEEDLVNQEVAKLDREGILVDSYRQYFGGIRRTAPAEDRKLLEIPYSESQAAAWFLWHMRLYIPTGAYPRESYMSGVLATPPECDLEVIKKFIECANRLLPDDGARERAGFKLEDLQFTLRSVRGITRPPYTKTEREELLPPRHLQAILNKSQ